ncbi:ABC transporter permease [Paenibacillus polymyxa]|uniref:ABC transporter permease n=1 Tax=Paenibacillus TaxID=44249 RepID=UPI00088FEF80|nr:ABC transporter permease [Paenibacillus sp. CF095]UOK64423.1 ABC transporter permease [Paenibacillus sp. OVF10]SDD10334.1 putative hydroxymethylpyrimidine transport system permease protein [Paenibacillus sp. CF095]
MQIDRAEVSVWTWCSKWLSRSFSQYGLFIMLMFLSLAIWEVIVRMEWVPSFIIPAPTAIIGSLVEHRHLLLTIHLPATFMEVAVGFGLSIVTGITLATGMHMNRSIEKALYPFIVISQTIPLIALSPVFILWFGYTLWSKVAVVFLIAFFPIVVSTYDGLRQGDPEQRELLLTMGASKWDIFCKLQVPLALPSFFSGLKMSVVYCVVGATIGEWLGGSKGLGYFSRRMSSNMNTDAMFAAIVLLSLLGIVLFVLIAWLEKRFSIRRHRHGGKRKVG